MEDRQQLTPAMRAILIDWLVEVQENFELYHETLYLAVRIVDLYLQENEIDKHKLQLIGATAMLIASKIEVFCQIYSYENNKYKEQCKVTRIWHT